ncbi:hypothetical protein [Streptomyces sp. NPDC047841]|uniref:hypothetical protein n=1 Tax=Streptomyces sp. NPDC047841 TaxID=3154708 RepID=UPI00345707D9
MDTKHCALDGWVDAIPAPGPRTGTATFDLIVRPADIDALDDDAPDTVVTCTSGDPRITHELLNGLQPGDLLRVTGTLVQPRHPASPPGSPSTPWRSWTPDSSRSCGTW